MKISITSSLMAAALMLLGGCSEADIGLPSSGNQESTGDLGNTLDVTTAPYLKVSLSTGALTPLVDPGDLQQETYRRGDMLFRRVSNDQGIYFLAVFEVTQAQWELMGGSDSWSAVPTKIVGDDAVGFDRPAFALSHVLIEDVVDGWNAGKEHALAIPSQAKWQAAAGANSFPWGNASSEAVNYAHTWETRGVSAGSPAPVGSLTPDSRGFFDMAGNVWEWTQGGYQLRGGSWYDVVDNCGNERSIGAAQGFGEYDGHALFGVRLELRLN